MVDRRWWVDRWLGGGGGWLGGGGGRNPYPPIIGRLFLQWRVLSTFGGTLQRFGIFSMKTGSRCRVQSNIEIARLCRNHNLLDHHRRPPTTAVHPRPPSTHRRLPPSAGVSYPFRRAVPCHAVPWRAAPCRAKLWNSVPLRAVPCRAVLCRAMPCRAVPCSVAACPAMPVRAVPIRVRASVPCRALASLIYVHDVYIYIWFP